MLSRIMSAAKIPGKRKKVMFVFPLKNLISFLLFHYEMMELKTHKRKVHVITLKKLLQ